MRNLKKFFAVVLAVAMVAMFVSVPVMATADYTTEAGYLQAMNLLRGSDGDLMLDKAPNRLEALVMLLYLTGEADNAAAYMTDEAAKAYLAGKGFTDAEDITWGASIAAYCVDNGYLYGNGDKLDLYSQVTAEMFAAYMLRVVVPAENLPAWDGKSANLSALQAKGAYSASDLVTFALADSFTRELAAGMMYGVLSVPIEKEEGNGKTVAQNLFDNGVITAEQASAGNVSVSEPTPEPTPTPVPFAATGVQMVSSKVAIVSFNAALDSDTVDEDNFVFGDAAPKKVELQSDNMSVKLIAADGKEVATGNSYTIKVKTDVKAADGQAIASETTFEGTYFDATLPTVVGFEQTGPKEATITFSEPISSAPTVKINNDQYSSTVGSITGDELNQVKVTWTASFSEGTVYTFTISDAKDFSGYTMTSASKELTYVTTDGVDITASIDGTPSQTTVTVKFNKAVKLANADTNCRDYFYHTFTAWQPTTATATDLDGDYAKTFELQFSTYYIPEGSTTLVIKKDVGDGTEITDQWGNKLASDISIPITVTADKTAPEVTKVEAVENNQKAIEVTFSEAVTGADDKDNYSVKDADGEDVEIDSVSYDSDDKVATLTFADNLSGTYTVVVTGVKDTALTANTIAENSNTVTINDVTDPNVTTVEIVNNTDDKDIIYVTFDEAMATSGDYSVLDADNYMYSTDNGSTWSAFSDPTVSMFGEGNKVVKIVVDDVDALDGTDDVLQIARVSDANGNVIDAIATLEGIRSASEPAVYEVRQTAIDTLEVEFNTVLDNSTIAASDFYVTVGGSNYEAAARDFGTDDDGNTVVTLTFGQNAYDAASLDTDDTDNLFTVLGIKAEAVAAQTGIVNSSVITSSPVDEWVPHYVSSTAAAAVAATPSTITLTFSEAISETNETFYVNDLVVTDADGDTLTPGVDYTTNATGSTIVITLSGVDDPTDYSVASKDSITYIKGADGNKITTFDKVTPMD